MKTISGLKFENKMLKEHLVKMGVDTTNLVHKDVMLAVDSTLAQTKRSQADTLVTHGMWAVRHYVDDFGAPTKDGYVTNAQPVTGTFSNSATQDSPLNVSVMANQDRSIAIQLYEYAGNNPVKAYDYKDYDLKMRDNVGKVSQFKVTNYKSDRILIEGTGASTLQAALAKGGKIQLVVSEMGDPRTHYNFAIDNAAGFADARKMLGVSTAAKGF